MSTLEAISVKWVESLIYSLLRCFACGSKAIRVVTLVTVRSEVE